MCYEARLQNLLFSCLVYVCAPVGGQRNEMTSPTFCRDVPLYMIAPKGQLTTLPANLRIGSLSPRIYGCERSYLTSLHTCLTSARLNTVI